jgi:hypothetical protein
MSPMNWRQFISSVFEEADRAGEYGVAPRYEANASEKDLQLMAKELKNGVPASLRELLLETNGVMSMLDLGRDGHFITNQWLVWPIAQIIENNREQRSGEGYATDLDHSKYLFFTTADGIHLGYNLEEKNDTIYAWLPIDDEFIQIADSLQDGLRKFISGDLGV